MSINAPPSCEPATVFDEAIQEHLDHVVLDTICDTEDEPYQHIPSEHACCDSDIARPICGSAPRVDWDMVSTDGVLGGYRRFCADCRMIAMNMFDISPDLVRLEDAE